MGGTVQTRINQLALVASVVLFVAIGLLWWRDRTRVWEAPRWDETRWVAIAPATAPVPASGRRLLIAVHPGCSHCRTRLAQLAAEGAADSLGAPLAALLVDVEPRPGRVELGTPLPGGIWWDSAGAWRNAWGRRVYGEGYVFTAGGALERVVPPEGDWRRPAPR
ncbi:MAG: hypothetical protein U0704_17845 [Candidatus Eisenbacteria bacterium]